jgi:hypothetical protein
MTDEDMVLDAWKHLWKWENGTNDYMYGDRIFTKNMHSKGRVILRFARGHTNGPTGWLYIQDNGEVFWNVNAKIK